MACRTYVHCSHVDMHIFRVKCIARETAIVMLIVSAQTTANFKKKNAQDILERKKLREWRSFNSLAARVCQWNELIARSSTNLFNIRSASVTNECIARDVDGVKRVYFTTKKNKTKNKGKSTGLGSPQVYLYYHGTSLQQYGTVYQVNNNINTLHRLVNLECTYANYTFKHLSHRPRPQFFKTLNSEQTVGLNVIGPYLQRYSTRSRIVIVEVL